MPWDDVKRQCYTMGFFIVGIGVLVGIPHFLPNDDVFVLEDIREVPENPSIKNPFAELELNAQAVYVYDITTRDVLFSYKEHEVMPLASVTKLMTAYVGSELIPEYNEVIISPDALAQEGDSGLFAHERWNVHDLVDYTLLVSSNDGAYALASTAGARVSMPTTSTTTVERAPREYFIDAMNQEAKTLGLSRTYFINESGLDVNEGAAGAYGTARDMAILLSHIVQTKPEILEATRYNTRQFESLHELAHTATNTNIIADLIPGLIGSKTGYTDLAGGNLVISFDAGIGYPIVVSVLGSTLDGRFDDVEKLVNATIQYLAHSDNIED